MSIGRLVVELELRDGQFHASMRQAQSSVTGLSNNLTSLSSSLNRTKSDLHSTIPHLRDIAIVSSSAYSIISSFNETIGALAKSLIKSNAEIERTTVLLQGLSKSIDIKDKAKDAQKDLNFLLDTAKNAPFSLKELSNAFVKMRTVGLEDVESKLKSLTNSIAKFGGNDETLHRSTVAIQQMASKGVISMEELRQQLGESIPNAMNMMADGMGMSMGSMTQKISEGKIKALPAIRVMLQEMEFTMRGSSEKMMNTWNGMTSQLATNWMLLQKKIGDAGLFDSAKGAVNSLNELLKGDEAVKYAGIVGSGIDSAINGIKKLSEFYDKHTESIQNAGKALLSFWAISKTVSGIIAARSGMINAYANMSAVPGTLSRMTQDSLIRRETQIIPAVPINWGNNGLTTPISISNVAERTREVVTNTTAWQRALGLSSVALAGLVSPLGQIGILAAAAAYQFGLFDTDLDKAKEGIEDIVEKQKELNKIKGINRVEGDVAIKTKDDLAEAQKNLDLLRKGIESKKESITMNLRRSYISDEKINYILKSENSGIPKLERDADIHNTAILEGKRDLYRRIELAAKTSQENIVTSELSVRTTNYKIQADFINKGIDLEKQANEKRVGLAKKTNDDIDKMKEKAFEELHRKEIQETIDSLSKSIEIQKKSIEETKSVNPVIASLSFNVDEKGKLETQINEAEAALSLFRGELNNTANDAQKSEIAKKISDKENDLGKLKEKLVSVKEVIDNIFIKTTPTNPNWDAILNFPLGMQKLAALNAELKRFLNMKSEMDNGVSISEEAIISGNTDKKINADRDKLIAKWQSALESFTERYSKYADPYNKNENVSSVDVKDPASVQKFLDIFIKESKTQTLSQRIINGESGGDYNAYNRGVDKSGNIIRSDRSIDFTSMTIADVLKMERSRGTPDFVNSVGKYQMVGGTLEAGAKSLGLDVNKELLSPAIQERIMNEYIIAAKRPAFTSYLTGKGNDLPAAMSEIRSEFTSLKTVNDKSLAESLLMLKGDTQRLMNEGMSQKEAIAEAFKSSKVLSDPSKMSDEEIKAQTVAMNGLRDALVTRTEDEKGIVEAQKSLAKQQIDTKNQQDRRNGVSENKIPATLPEIWYKNNEEIDKRKRYGVDYSGLIEQNKIIEQESSMKRLAEDAKKTYEIKKSIDDKEIHNAEQRERALQGIQDDSADNLIKSQYELTKNVQSLYELDIKNFKDAVTEKLVQSGQAMTQEGRNLAEKLTNEYEETKRNKEKIAALNAEYNNNTDISIAKNSRGSGTSFSKDMFAAEQNYSRDVYNTISDAASSNGTVSPEKLAQDIDQLTAKYKDSVEQIKYNHRNAFEIMSQEELDFHQVSGDIAAKFVTDFSSGFADMVVNGKKSFGELVVSVLRGIAQMMIQLAMMKIMQKSLSFMFLDSGGVVGGNLSGGDNVAPTPNVVMAKYGGITAFASGGSMFAKKASKEMMLDGGIKNEPHVALFAEAGIPEAFIPMQDRKTIPISVTKDADGTISASVLLPKGRSIPASIKQLNEKQAITKYALGGTTNGNTVSSISSYTQNDIGGSFDNLARSISNVSEKLVQVSNQMMNGGNGEIQRGLNTGNNISISINVENGSGNSQDTKKNNAGGQADIWSKMADNVRAIVVKTLIEEKKQGGIIFNGGS